MAGKPKLLPIQIEVAKRARSRGVRVERIASWFDVSRVTIMWHTTPGYKEKTLARIERYHRKLDTSFTRNQRRKLARSIYKFIK